MARTHIVAYEQFLPISLNDAWQFFSTPRNLSRITPSDMRFKILSTDTDRPIFSGMRIEYQVRPILGIPTRWSTEIRDVDAPNQFTDTQLKGPFTKWVHTHRFTEVPGGIHMNDLVEYALPLGFIGELAHRLFVKHRIETIFIHREKVLNTIFATA